MVGADYKLHHKVFNSDLIAKINYFNSYKYVLKKSSN